MSCSGVFGGISVQGQDDSRLWCCDFFSPTWQNERIFPTERVFNVDFLKLVFYSFVLLTHTAGVMVHSTKDSGRSFWKWDNNSAPWGHSFVCLKGYADREWEKKNKACHFWEELPFFFFLSWGKSAHWWVLCIDACLHARLCVGGGDDMKSFELC